VKKYSYQGAQLLKKVVSQLAGCIGILFFSVFALFLLAAIPSLEMSKSTPILNDPGVTLFCFAGWFLFIAWIIGSIFINFLPNIWINEDGLQISVFIFFRVRILWGELVDIGAGTPPKDCVLVRTQKITLFHRLYGWLYSRTFYPSFLIGNNISDRDGLVNEIKRRIN